MSVVIIGGGIAGTAAAFAARARGATVTWVLGTSGATMLAPGTFDLAPWQRRDGPTASAVPLSREAGALLDALAYVATGGPAWVATTAGILRPCQLRDAALLDLGALHHGALVALPRAVHAEWDADALAATLASDPEAVARGLRFEAREVTVQRFRDERFLPHLTLARRHDDEERTAWLAARLRESSPTPDAWLLPPWLGTRGDVAVRLRAAVGVPVGEAISLPPSSSGERFRVARDALMPEVSRIQGFVRRVHDDRRVDLESGEALVGDAIVLAAGGIAVGGLRYTPAEATLAGELPTTTGPAVSLGFEAPVSLGARGGPLLQPGSMQGPQPERIAWPYVDVPLLETVGIHEAPAGIFAAGDIAADLPRTWLAALESGLRAGRDAAELVKAR